MSGRLRVAFWCVIVGGIFALDGILAAQPGEASDWWGALVGLIVGILVASGVEIGKASR